VAEASFPFSSFVQDDVPDSVARVRPLPPRSPFAGFGAPGLGPGRPLLFSRRPDDLRFGTERRLVLDDRPPFFLPLVLGAFAAHPGVRAEASRCSFSCSRRASARSGAGRSSPFTRSSGAGSLGDEQSRVVFLVASVNPRHGRRFLGATVSLDARRRPARSRDRRFFFWCRGCFFCLIAPVAALLAGVPAALSGSRARSSFCSSAALWRRFPLSLARFLLAVESPRPSKAVGFFCAVFRALASPPAGFPDRPFLGISALWRRGRGRRAAAAFFSSRLLFCCSPGARPPLPSARRRFAELGVDFREKSRPPLSPRQWELSQRRRDDAYRRLIEADVPRWRPTFSQPRAGAQRTCSSPLGQQGFPRRSPAFFCRLPRALRRPTRSSPSRFCCASVLFLAREGPRTEVLLEPFFPERPP